MKGLLLAEYLGANWAHGCSIAQLVQVTRYRVSNHSETIRPLTLTQFSALALRSEMDFKGIAGNLIKIYIFLLNLISYLFVVARKQCFQMLQVKLDVRAAKKPVAIVEKVSSIA